MGQSPTVPICSAGPGRLQGTCGDKGWEKILVILADLYFGKYINQLKDYAHAIELSPLDLKVRPNPHYSHTFRRAWLTAEHMWWQGMGGNSSNFSRSCLVKKPISALLSLLGADRFIASKVKPHSPLKLSPCSLREQIFSKIELMKELIAKFSLGTAVFLIVTNFWFRTAMFSPLRNSNYQ